jgi:hypothetical protein
MIPVYPCLGQRAAHAKALNSSARAWCPIGATGIEPRHLFLVERAPLSRATGRTRMLRMIDGGAMKMSLNGCELLRQPSLEHPPRRAHGALRRLRCRSQYSES